jgi:hypothetical protein
MNQQKEKITFSAKTIALLIIAALLVGFIGGKMTAPRTDSVITNAGNFTDEMKLPYTADLKDYGANTVERDGDHPDSPYFYSMDFYNAESTETLDILPQFKTIQQTSWWSCGISCMEMILDYYGMRGDWNEETLPPLRENHEDMHPGTCLEQMIQMFDAVGGFELETTYDYIDDTSAINFDFLQQHIKDGIPVMVAWSDWGGHWQIIIGYDDMGTEYRGDDVIIVADPFDTTDHNQDGYGVYGAERFLNTFYVNDFRNAEGHVSDYCFVAPTPTRK